MTTIITYKTNVPSSQDNSSTTIFVVVSGENDDKNYETDTNLSSKNVNDLKNINDSSIDTVLLLTTSSALVSEALLQISCALKPNGCVVAKTLDETINLSQSLLYSGYINITSKDGEYVAYKPSWKQGESAKLSFKKAKTAWTLAASDLNDDGIVLADEDDLLANEEEKVDVPIRNNDMDCGKNATTTRKACKNCTCGRAEELQSENTAATTKKSSGGCGSCGLGDAFRCSTCPYLGKPAFTTTTGNAVKLAL